MYRKEITHNLTTINEYSYKFCQCLFHDLIKWVINFKINFFMNQFDFFSFC